MRPHTFAAFTAAALTAVALMAGGFIVIALRWSAGGRFESDCRLTRNTRRERHWPQDTAPDGDSRVAVP